MEITLTKVIVMFGRVNSVEITLTKVIVMFARVNSVEITLTKVIVMFAGVNLKKNRLRRAKQEQIYIIFPL